ncbi:MAG TPA: hypothetical protein EYN91_20800 [Candidatus Melainabacteria bacterium]|jgi:hypothetical protein|nr:hypothetical protein [Candidatus Melainabacteria bacterium]HIN65322.1 hypothetical protein [Candidatus Obscuribacterales bacterium]
MKEPKNDGGTATKDQQTEKPAVERRRASLPQPDFTHYKKASAYPGPKYLFVGHSYNVELDNQEGEGVENRAGAIKSLFSKDIKWIPVSEALGNQNFSGILSRFEHDLLSRLPESSLVGEAINTTDGKEIKHSFTIWREERRGRREDRKA